MTGGLIEVRFTCQADGCSRPARDGGPVAMVGADCHHVHAHRRLCVTHRFRRDHVPRVCDTCGRLTTFSPYDGPQLVVDNS